MLKFQSKSIISIGFLTIMAIIVVFLVVWMDTVVKNKQYLGGVKATQGEIYLITDLIEQLNINTNSLHHLLGPVLDKQKIRQDIVQATKNMKLLSMDLTQENGNNTLISWSRELQAYFDAQKQFLAYLSRDEAGRHDVGKHNAETYGAERKSAEQYLFNKVSPLHHQLMGRMHTMMDAYKASAKSGLDSALGRNDSVYYLIVMLGVAAILLGMLNILVIRITSKTEAALLDQGKSVRRLYEITSKPGLSIEEQIRGILKLGCELLGMQIGKVCQVDEEKNTNSFLNVYAPEGFDVCAGTVMPLNKTFCSITIQDEDTLALHDVSKSIYRERFSHLAAYTSTAIMVNGKPYGSVNFSSNLVKESKFTEADKDLVSLIGAWVSSTLERRFAQEDLLIAKNEAEAASRTKSAFLANMSHELRTPLNAIIGYSELIQEEAAFNDHHMYDKDLHMINSSALHLLALIDDILDLSKIEAGKMEFYMEAFSIADLASEVAEIVTPLMKKKNNVFKVSLDESLGSMYSDRLKMKQVLFNLLSNASKFTEEGTVTLEVKTNTNIHKQDNSGQPNEILFIVEDTGIGISDKQISKIFEAFAQADMSTASKFGGTGLGLAISRQICQLLNGDINVKGAIGQGTRFIVTLPLNVSPPSREIE